MFHQHRLLNIVPLILVLECNWNTCMRFIWFNTLREVVGRYRLDLRWKRMFNTILLSVWSKGGVEVRVLMGEQKSILLSWSMSFQHDVLSWLLKRCIIICDFRTKFIKNWCTSSSSHQILIMLWVDFDDTFCCVGGIWCGLSLGWGATLVLFTSCALFSWVLNLFKLRICDRFFDECFEIFSEWFWSVIWRIGSHLTWCNCSLSGFIFAITFRVNSTRSSLFPQHWTLTLLLHNFLLIPCVNLFIKTFLKHLLWIKFNFLFHLHEISNFSLFHHNHFSKHQPWILHLFDYSEKLFLFDWITNLLKFIGENWELTPDNDVHLSDIV